MTYDPVWQSLDKPLGALSEVHFYNLISCIHIITSTEDSNNSPSIPKPTYCWGPTSSQLHALQQLLTMGGNEPGSFSVHLCAQLGHNFHWEPHQHISDNAMIDSGQDVHLKHSWNRYSIVYICIHTSSYKKHP